MTTVSVPRFTQTVFKYDEGCDKQLVRHPHPNCSSVLCVTPQVHDTSSKELYALDQNIIQALLIEIDCCRDLTSLQELRRGLSSFQTQFKSLLLPLVQNRLFIRFRPALLLFSFLLSLPAHISTHCLTDVVSQLLITPASLPFLLAICYSSATHHHPLQHHQRRFCHCDSHTFLTTTSLSTAMSSIIETAASYRKRRLDELARKGLSPIMSRTTQLRFATSKSVKFFYKSMPVALRPSDATLAKQPLSSALKRPPPPSTPSTPTLSPTPEARPNTEVAKPSRLPVARSELATMALLPAVTVKTPTATLPCLPRLGSLIKLATRSEATGTTPPVNESSTKSAANRAAKSTTPARSFLKKRTGTALSAAKPAAKPTTKPAWR